MRADQSADDIDLSLNFPAPGDEGDYIGDTLRRMADDPGSVDFLDYQLPASNLRHRAAGTAWLSTTGVHVDTDGVVITSGGPNGILVAFSALAQAGDHIISEELTFPGVKSVATMLGLRVQGLPIDEHVVIPEALENACRT